VAKTEPKKPGKERLADKAGIGERFEGEPIDKKEIEGMEVILVDFRFRPSSYKEGKDFVMVQLEVDGELRTCNIGGQVVVEGLHNIDKDKDLPAPVIFVKDKTADGKRTFWTMK